MWIVFHLFGAGLGFLLRCLSLTLPFGDKTVSVDRWRGSTRYTQTIVTRKSKLRSFRLEIPFSASSQFTFTPETQGDLFFKYIGLSREFQTGDSRFDSHVYVAAEDPMLLTSLRESAEIRGLLLAALRFTVQRIGCDGSTLFVVAEEQLSADEWIPVLTTLAETFSTVSRGPARSWSDPFVHRVLVVEAGIWGMAGYAATGLLETAYVRPHDIHVGVVSIVAYGVGFGLVCAGLGLFVIVALLRRSSRSHRPIVESALVLSWALPILGIQLASDLNLGLNDVRPPIAASALVVAKHADSHSRRARTYRLTIADVKGPVVLPESINVPKYLFDSVSENQGLELEIGFGGLGIPYYRSINGRPVP